MKKLLAFAMGCLSLLPSLLFAEATKAPLGRAITDFSLQDFRGKEVTLADFRSDKLLVVAFLGTECPLAKLYAGRLVKMAEQYADDGVGFLAIDANRQDSITEIAAFARRHNIGFPILKDPANRVADQFGAVRTPEVFLLDQDRTVRYWGRIDDQYGVDFVREAPTREDLRIAIDELLAGKAVSVPVTTAPGCFIGRVQKPNPDCDVTYSNQIARILQNRCVECHRDGEIAPFSLTDYEEVAGWAETIAEVVDEGRMPPWHADPQFGQFKNDRHLSDEEKRLIFKWVANGAPQGDPSQLPPPKQFEIDWNLPQEPDLIVPVSPEPFRVPAEGEVKYQYFQYDPKFTEDKWIRAAEFRPGNRTVVHHILVFARTPDGRLRGAGGGAHGYLAGYVPGLRVEPLPEGMAKRIPAGSKFVFQVHYTPIGSPQLDQSHFGMVFADAKDVTHEVKTTSAVNPGLRIPPHDDNYQVEATSRTVLDDNTLLLAFMPHMHLRGKAFEYQAVLENGTRETLLKIPHYDFNWQTAYWLAQPRTFPAGTKIHCVAHYDNSESNLNNPDPSKLVRWGDQTWEEMMIGYFDVAVPVDSRADGEQEPSDRQQPLRTLIEKRIDEKAREIIDRYDKNDDGIVRRAEVPERLQRTFDRLDANGDGEIDFEELRSRLRASERSP